jgi:hypothetical protein
MPVLSRWMVKASLLYLLAGFTLGSLILWNKGLPFYPAVWRFLPAHIEFLLIGWCLQLAMGVAFWILPRFITGARYGDEPLFWLSFGLLNVGIWLVVMGGVWWVWFGRLAELAAVGLYVFQMWARVKPLGV